METGGVVRHLPATYPGPSFEGATDSRPGRYWLSDILKQMRFSYDRSDQCSQFWQPRNVDRSLTEVRVSDLPLEALSRPPARGLFSTGGPASQRRKSV